MLYQPDQAPEDIDSLARYVHTELMRVAAVLELALVRSVEFQDVAPTKVKDGMVCAADGTNWNPGSGQGVYVYYGAAWHLLG